MSTSNSSTDRPAHLLEIGRITKPHGLKGDVVVVLITDRTERLDVGSVLETDRGPVRVEHSQLDGLRWLVHFAEIAGREAAESWRGTLLRAEPLDDRDQLWVHELVGSRVVDHDGIERGEVLEVQANPASDLMVLNSGALVPLTFVVDGPRDGVVVVEVPDGLWELWS